MSRARCVVRDDPTLPPGLRDASRVLAQQLALPLRVDDAIDPRNLVLAITVDGLVLRAGDTPDTHGFRVDFRARTIPSRGAARPGHADRAQPLLRAIGRRTRQVLDATAGFGGDAIALASLGYRVCAVERSKVVAALLRDGRERALADPELREAARRLAIRCADTRDVLCSLAEPPDTVFIDPMFPAPRKRTALPRLAIQLLRRLVGEDADAEQLFALARRSGAKRVVVKRPLHAPSLGKEPPDACHHGKLVRYDVHIGARTEGGGEDADRKSRERESWPSPGST